LLEDFQVGKLFEIPCRSLPNVLNGGVEGEILMRRRTLQALQAPDPVQPLLGTEQRGSTETTLHIAEPEADQAARQLLLLIMLLLLLLSLLSSLLLNKKKNVQTV
jgi:hypothetical protein